MPTSASRRASCRRSSWCWNTHLQVFARSQPFNGTCGASVHRIRTPSISATAEHLTPFDATETARNGDFFTMAILSRSRRFNLQAIQSSGRHRCIARRAICNASPGKNMPRGSAGIGACTAMRCSIVLPARVVTTMTRRDWSYLQANSGQTEGGSHQQPALDPSSVTVYRCFTTDLTADRNENHGGRTGARSE